MFKRGESEVPAGPADPAVGNKRSFLLGLTITALNPTLIATWGAAVAAVHSCEVIRSTRTARCRSRSACASASRPGS